MAAEEPCASPTLAMEEPPAITTLATEEPPASPTLAPVEPSDSPEQELSDCATNTSSSAYSCGASSSSMGSGSPVFEGSLFGDTLSAQMSWGEEEEEEEEEEDLSPILVIQQHLQSRAELVADRAKQLRFLHAVLCLWFSAQKQGRDTLEPLVSKAALVESIAELIENLPCPSEPSSIVPSSMAAVCSLSKLKPLLALELESRLLRALLNRMYTLGTGQDTTHFQVSAPESEPSAVIVPPLLMVIDPPSPSTLAAGGSAPNLCSSWTL